MYRMMRNTARGRLPKGGNARECRVDVDQPAQQESRRAAAEVGVSDDCARVHGE